MATTVKPGQEEKITALYGRLSDDDGVDMESNSISNQRMILQDYARLHGYLHPRFFYDDGVSGTTFEREGFKEMEALVEAGGVSTIIVKDLSRFGRNYLEVGRYLEVIYPTLGVKFIAIQENVDTLEGTGTEMMPFHNIFNEWYAAQTSKKIRAVWAMKVANGKRIGSSVPYGYVKDPNDHEKWYIDEPAAEVVRKIYALFMGGKGPMQIANQLEDERIMCPTAYKFSAGRVGNHPAPANPYVWSSNTVARILDNRQYTGCTVNFKRTTVSYKAHKIIYKPENEWQIIPDTHEATIGESTWLRVHELRQNRRRPTATGRTSLFSGLVYCPDCGAKLHFSAAKSLKRNQEHFRCANYKSGRGECTIHFIRDVVLKQIVWEAVSGLADFVQNHQSVFLFMLAKQNVAVQKQELQAARNKLEQGRKRIKEIDALYARIYEDNAAGRISDERFARLSATYEAEQADLETSLTVLEQRLEDADKASVDLHMLLKGLREFTEVRELTPTIVNTLIRRIEVHNNEKKHSHGHVKVDIYFTAVGIIDLPTARELQAMMDEINTDARHHRLTA